MPTTQETLEQLRAMIGGQALPPQSRLPAERLLAIELGVTRTTLRAALAKLEAEGEVWRHIGRGTFVGQKPSALAETDIKTEAFSIEATNPLEFLEMRLIFEPGMCALAAMRATPAEIAHMERCIAESERTTEIRDFELWDSRLHRAIAAASRNRLLEGIYTAADSIRGDNKVWGQLKKATVTGQRKSTYVDQHRAFVKAIRDRDVHEAEKAMREHIISIRANLLGPTA